MPFTVEIASQVIEYLESREQLSWDDQIRIINGTRQELSESADIFLTRNPHPYLPDRFWYNYILMTEAHEVREFRFACDGRGHVYGITEVLYTEERPETSD